MPKKPKGQKKVKKGRKKHRKSTKSKLINTGQHSKIVYYSKAGIHSPIPMEYHTKFIACASTYTQSGAGTGDIILNLNLNSCRLPFNAIATTLNFNTIAPTTYQCTGFNCLVSNSTTGIQLYGHFIVKSVLFELDLQFQNEVDACVIAGTPSATANVPAHMGTALGKPWTKTMNFSFSRGKYGSFPYKHYINIADWIGMPQYLYDNDVSGQWWGTGAADPVNNYPYVVNFETYANTTFANPVGVQIRVTYYVKLFDVTTEVMNN